MIKEIDIGGVLITPFLAWALIALLINAILTRIFNRIGLYRLIWHRHLFDAAVFVILFAGVTFMMSQR
jgi:hypothetical protein